MTQIPQKTRDKILSKIKRNLKNHPHRNIKEISDRIRRHPRNLIPERSRGNAEILTRNFQNMLEKAGASYEHINTLNHIPEKIAIWLKYHNMPAEIRIAQDPLLQNIQWQKTIDIKYGAPNENDKTTLTHAYAGIAETGTLIMLSGKTSPTTANFLPENHLVILRKSQIFGAYEDIWDHIRHNMPRTVNMITGPSRTGDIEQTILMGAHGPKRLHIFILS